MSVSGVGMGQLASPPVYVPPAAGGDFLWFDASGACFAYRVADDLWTALGTTTPLAFVGVGGTSTVFSTDADGNGFTSKDGGATFFANIDAVGVGAISAGSVTFGAGTRIGSGPFAGLVLYGVSGSTANTDGGGGHVENGAWNDRAAYPSDGGVLEQLTPQVPGTDFGATLATANGTVIYSVQLQGLGDTTTFVRKHPQTFAGAPDNGSTVTLPTPGVTVLELEVAAQADVLLAIVDDAGTKQLWRNTGTSFADVTPSDATYTGFRRIRSSDGTTWLAISTVGGVEEILRSTDGGVTWARVAGTASIMDPASPLALNAAGAALVQSVNAGKIQRSTDDGATWTELDAPGGATDALALDPLEGF